MSENSGNTIVGADYGTSDSDPQFESCVCMSCVESGLLRLEVSDGNLIHKGLAASAHFDGNTNKKDHDHQTVNVTYRNWKDLVPDILCIILKPLRLVDNIRFGCVCKNWYSAALNSHSRGVAPQSPFLLLPGDDTGASDYYQFFDLLHQSFYKIHLPQLRNRRCFGSSEGKLIYIDEIAELHVLDPISGSQFDLPSITTLPDVGEPVFDGDGNVTGYFIRNRKNGNSAETVAVDYFINCYFLKVIICPKTSVVVAFTGLHLAFCLPGDESWTLIEDQSPDVQRYEDAVFYKGVLYSITYFGQFVSFHLGDDDDDLKNIKFQNLGECSLPKDWNVFWYLVEANGDLLMVWRFVHLFKIDDSEFNRTIGVEVHRMNWATNQWEQMMCLGEYALFLGLNHSTSLSTRNFPELKANSIYFTDDHLENHAIYPHQKRDIGVFNLENGSMELFYPCDDDHRLNWPPPIWFTPKSLPQRQWRNELYPYENQVTRYSEDLLSGFYPS